MKISMSAAFIATLLCIAAYTRADSSYATKDSVPSTVRPRMKSDENGELTKVFLDSWIQYDDDQMSEYQKNLFIPKNFYYYE
jgi:hypothetical protein